MKSRRGTFHLLTIPFLLSVASAAPPLWWSQGDPPVINGNPAQNKGVANVGQAKWVAKQALEALRKIIPVAPDMIEGELVGAGKPISKWDAPANQEESDANYAPLLVGQLKALAHPFYASLQQVAPEWLKNERIANGTNSVGSFFPWTADTSDDSNKSVANIGQLKSVFSLRFELDTDSNGIPDLWEYFHFGGLGIVDVDEYADLDGDGLGSNSEQIIGSDPMLKDHPILMLEVTVK